MSDGAIKMLQSQIQELKQALEIKDLVIAQQHAELVRRDNHTTLRAENERLREALAEVDKIVDECEYNKKTRHTVDRLRSIAKEALK